MATARTTTLLAIATTLSSAWLVFFEPLVATTAERRASERRVLAMRSDEVERLLLQRDRWTRAVVERVDGGFRVSEPLPGAADAAAVQALLSQLEFLEHDRRLTGEEADESHRHLYGLTTPALELRLATSDSAEHHLRLGREAPAGGTWLEVQGDPSVYVVDTAFLDASSGLLDRLSEER